MYHVKCKSTENIIQYRPAVDCTCDKRSLIFFLCFSLKIMYHMHISGKIKLLFLRTLDTKTFKHKYSSSLVVPIQSVPPVAIVSCFGVDVTHNCVPFKRCKMA